MFAKNQGSIRLGKGQSTVEYLVFFAALAVLTLLSLCAFYPRVQQACDSGFQEAVGEILR